MTAHAGFMTIQQAAELLGFNTTTIRTYIADGKLPAYRVPGYRAIRLKVDDVHALMKPVNAWSHNQATA